MTSVRLVEDVELLAETYVQQANVEGTRLGGN
jgi:hypothetical protein